MFSIELLRLTSSNIAERVCEIGIEQGWEQGAGVVVVVLSGDAGLSIGQFRGIVRLV